MWVPPRRIEQLQNLLLPVRQQVKGIGQTTCLEPADVVLDEDCGHGWTEERFAGRDAGGVQLNRLRIVRAVEADRTGLPRKRAVGLQERQEEGRRDSRVPVSSYSRSVYASGSLLFVRDGSLLALPFDVDKGKVSGEPVPLEKGVGNSLSGQADFSVSAEGTLVIVPDVPSHYWWVDRTGKRIDELKVPTNPDSRTCENPVITLGIF